MTLTTILFSFKLPLWLHVNLRAGGRGAEKVGSTPFINPLTLEVASLNYGPNYDSAVGGTFSKLLH